MLPIQWTATHIKGHQDRNNSLASLSRTAILNVEEDTLAKSMLPSAKEATRHYHINLEPWSIWFQQEKNSIRLHSWIYNIIHSEEAKDYWASNRKLSRAVIDSVDWNIIDSALKEVPQNQQTFVTKHSVGMCGVGKFLKHWKERTSDACPRYSAPLEDSAHVWTCAHPDGSALWDQSLTKLKGWMEANDTDPDIQETISRYLNSWRYSGTLTTLPIEALAPAVNSQNSIGWREFFEGWPSREWAVAQQNYFNFLSSRRTGKRWLIALLKKLWNIAWDLWAHRNGILHQKENAVQLADLEQLDRELRSAYFDLRQLVQR